MADTSQTNDLAAVRAAYQDPTRRTTDRGRFEVLVLDDSTFDQNRIKRACGKTGLPVTTRMTSSIEEFEKALDEKSYDVILIDYMLPKGNGLAAQRIVNDHPMNFGAAVVMISSEMRTDVAIASMKKGSMDCLNKDALDPEKLRELMIASAKIFSEASRHWIGELLAQQRVQIAQDVAKVVREEMEFGRFIDTIDKRIIDMLASKGFSEAEAWNVSYLFDADEPLKFR
ncbi:response regulator [Sagittula sp. S175]|uniref:response regulator n=1 Tax=Sagittula sp. S175 TaxID=3415129 RepID=UPI003C7E2AB2